MFDKPVGALLKEIALTYWPVLFWSLVVSFIATPICRYVARKRNIVDRPDDWLKPHHQPIPYLGGVAMYAAWAIGIVLGMWWIHRLGSQLGKSTLPLFDPLLIGVLVGGTLVMAIGLFDDLRLASPRAKLIGTIIVALVLVSFGIGDDLVRSFFAKLNVTFDPKEQWLVWLYSVPIATFIVVGACNATNLLDGLDGLCSGVLGIVSLGFLVLAVHHQLYDPWQADDIRRVIITLSMMGAALGFLPYNRNPATIFMGDTGSMLLGYTAAVMILLFAEITTVRWMMGAIVVMGLPISDMILTLLRRWRAQRPLMQGDRSHFYDQLRDRGYSVKQVVVVSYLLSGAFALIGCLATIFFRIRHAVLIYAILFIVVAWAIGHFRMVRVDSPADRPHSDPELESHEAVEQPVSQ